MRLESVGGENVIKLYLSALRRITYFNVLNFSQVMLPNVQDLRLSWQRRGLYGNRQRSDIGHAIPCTVLCKSLHGNASVLAGSPAAIQQSLTVQPADDWFNGERFLSLYVSEQRVCGRFDV